MKSSRYNYFINNGENTIVFNGITEKFFEIKSENADIYKQLIKNPDSYGDEVSFFLNKLNRDGFVLDNDRDEKDIAEKKLTGQLAENLCHLMVMPTFNKRRQMEGMIKNIVRNNYAAGRLKVNF